MVARMACPLRVQKTSHFESAGGDELHVPDFKECNEIGVVGVVILVQDLLFP